MALGGNLHVGRGFEGNDLERDCPCGKAPCGLVDSRLVDQDCVEHGDRFTKTLRQMHTPNQCPANQPGFKRRPIPSLIIDKATAQTVLGMFFRSVTFRAFEFTVTEALAVRTMAELLDLNPGKYTPNKNRYLFPHKWTPGKQEVYQVQLLCSWCNRPYAGSTHHGGQQP